MSVELGLFVLILAENNRFLLLILGRLQDYICFLLSFCFAFKVRLGDENSVEVRGEWALEV